MMWLLDKLISVPFIGPILNSLFGFILNWQKQRLDAQGAHEVQVATIAAKTIELDQKEAELNSQLLTVEQGNWITRSIRPLLALPVVILAWKLLVWDKALGQWTNGTTEALSDQIWWYCTTVTIAYMGGRTLEKIGSTIAGVFRK